MGQPAACVGDMHVCPMVTPAVIPVPHVGGPILPAGAAFNILIGGRPAAVMGTMCVCVGPPDVIVRGSMGVLFGGRPAARMGDNTAHGGTIIIGNPTVLIGEIGFAMNIVTPDMPNMSMPDIPNMSVPPMPNMSQAPANMSSGGGGGGGGGGSSSSAQISTLKNASQSGTPFCEKCSK
jgi:uncharacterized Zn-binding protein involved in type VI secretion